MFDLMRHTGTTPWVETISRHRTGKAAKAALEAAKKGNPGWEFTGRYFIVKPTTLLTSTGRLTNAYWLIHWAKARDGVSVTKRQKGFSDYPQLMELVAEGLLENGNKGPRGGATWHATRKGRRAVAKVDDLQSEAL